MTSSFEKYGVEETLEISHGDWHAVVSIEGAALKTLSYRGEPIVVVPLPASDFTFAGSSLAPWANRLEDATWQLEGVTYRGEITETGNHNGLHGLLVHRYFEVVSSSNSSVTFGYRFGADEVYPFDVTFEVTYRLSDDGLKVTLAASNHTELELPIAFGSHPYFLLDADSKLKVSASKAAVNSSRQLPIGEQSISAISLSNQEFVPVTNLNLDDCLFELGDQPTTILSRPSIGLNVVVWQDPGLAYQMVFVRGERFAAGQPITLAIEPQTSPANSLASKKDLVWLAKHETQAFSWGITVESR